MEATRVTASGETGRVPGPGLSTAPRLSRRVVLVFAFACGAAVANLSYAQPLLDAIARDLHTSTATAGLLVTATQMGYATGLLFIVPLGDLLERRALILFTLCGTTLALLAAAASPNVAALAAAGLVIGVTSVVAQVIVPFAATLAGDAERGRVVGTVMSGLLIGSLLARTFSGVIAQVGGWRTVYVVAAGVMLLLIGVLARELPRRPRSAQGLTYGGLLRSVLALLRSEPVLRRRAAYGGLVFAAFSVFWTSIAFVLARPPYGYTEAAIGVFGLVGVAGALSASFAGRLADRGRTRAATGAFLLLLLLAFGLNALGGTSLLALLAGVTLLDFGVQGTHITNQSLIYALHPEARSRLTAAYMTTYFLGGALGSAASATVYSTVGWGGVCLVGALVALAALALWATEARR